jgi:hypothetical protein
VEQERNLPSAEQTAFHGGGRTVAPEQGGEQGSPLIVVVFHHT